MLEDALGVGVVLVARVLAALFSNISDCDETYNYWEPVSEGVGWRKR